jgi:demethylmenaquinone methyltransferase/2-methoxy-6-polyprenyl-1,4-benzoquinol methylase
MRMKTDNRLAGVLPDAENKPAYVNQMFGRIAARYDRLNSLMTAGQDRRWRNIALDLCDLPVNGRLLDVGAGTGAVASAGKHMYPHADMYATDFTWEMMRAGQLRGNAQSVHFALADAFRLPFGVSKFDAVITAFVMRNVVDRRDAFREQVRVTKPGGRIVCLETSPPHVVALGPLFRFYFFQIVPILGRFVAGDGGAYSYLPASTITFPPPGELARDMELAGLRNVTYRTLMFGSVAVHVGTK